jgi:hypothetical protein
MHAYRRRGRLILSDDVDANTQIESAVGGHGTVKPLRIRSANHKSVEQLSSEIRAGQHHDQPSERRYRATLAFLSLRDQSAPLAWRFLLAIPTGSSVWGTVEVSSGRDVRPGRWLGHPDRPAHVNDHCRRHRDQAVVQRGDFDVQASAILGWVVLIPYWVAAHGGGETTLPSR